MGRFSGMVGYAMEPVETSPDVFKEEYQEHKMTGSVLKTYSNTIEGDTRYDDITLANQISLVGGEFAFKNYSRIRYIQYLGQKWKVTSVDVQRPRLVVTLGGPWNE